MTTFEAPTSTATTAPAPILQPVDRIVANRYQKREADAGLADSIREHGLKQPPVGRWHPDRPGVIELAAGHRRLAAYQLLAKADPETWGRIPILVQDLTDRQMADTCIIENGQRLDLSAIEKGRTLTDYIREFGVSQAEAGKLFADERGRPLTQSAVSHLMALVRDLPADVQGLLHRGKIPERAARALLPLTHWAGQPKVVSQIAKAALEEDPGDRAERIISDIDQTLQRKAQSLSEWQRPWPLEWPPAPLAIDDAKTDKGEPATIPACKGCQFAVVRARTAYCLRKPCFDAKGRAWLRAEVQAAAEKLGIPVAAPGEKVSVVFNGSYYNEQTQKAAKLVRAKLPELRLAANPEHSNSQNLADVTGSKSVLLATTSTAAVEKFLNESRGKPAAAIKPANETPAQAERRKVAEKELAEERKLERVQFNRSKADVLWLVDHVSQLVAENTVAGGGLLAFMDDHITHGHTYLIGSDWTDLAERCDQILKAAGMNPGLTLAEAPLKGETGTASTPETPALAPSAQFSAGASVDRVRRQHLVYKVLASKLTGYEKAATVYGDVQRARRTAAELAKLFCVELPAGWDQAPIHHTGINCWQCGVFSASANGKLTQADTKDGWLSITAKDGVLQGVYCPQHSAKYKGKPLTESLAGDTPSKAPTIKPTVQPGRRLPAKPSAAAAAAAARAQVLRQAASKRGNVRGHGIGHSRPAPKPSQKKAARRKSTKKAKR